MSRGAEPRTRAVMNDVASGRKEILIVDDSDADVELLQHLLSAKNPNAVIHSVATGDEVLNFMRKKKDPQKTQNIDLVIIDLNLPKGGGLDILKELKSDENLRRVPVIVFTGSESEQDVDKAYELGANCYLVKPVAFEELSKVVGFIDSVWLRGSHLPPTAYETLGPD